MEKTKTEKTTMEKTKCCVCSKKEGEFKNCFRLCVLCKTKIHEKCIPKNMKNVVHVCKTCEEKKTIVLKKVLDVEYLKVIFTFILHVFSYIVNPILHFLLFRSYVFKGGHHRILVIFSVFNLTLCAFMIFAEFAVFIESKNDKENHRVLQHLFYMNSFLILFSLLYSTVGTFIASILEEDVFFKYENIFSLKYVEYGVFTNIFIIIMSLLILGVCALYIHIIKPRLYIDIMIQKKIVEKTQ